MCIFGNCILDLHGEVGCFLVILGYLLAISGPFWHEVVFYGLLWSFLGLPWFALGPENFYRIIFFHPFFFSVVSIDVIKSV